MVQYSVHIEIKEHVNIIPREENTEKRNIYSPFLTQEKELMILTSPKEPCPVFYVISFLSSKNQLMIHKKVWYF